MKIIKLITRIDQTGMTTNCLDLAEQYKIKGHEVFLIAGNTFKNSEDVHFIYERINKMNVNFIEFENKANISIFLKLVSLLKVIITIIKINPDIIHSQSPYMTFIPWLLKKKFISTIHVTDLKKRFEFKNATKTIAISKETHQYAMDVFQFKPKEIETVLHGVSDRFQKSISDKEKEVLKNKLGIPKGNIIIGLVSSIEFRKGHDVLLKAIEFLPDNMKDKITVLILGSDKRGTSIKWLNDLITNSSIKKQIIWEQFKDPKPFYDIIDIYVLPSRQEGFPLTSIEAMLSNCLVIRSDVEGASEQIIDKENGFVFKNEDTVELSEILSEVILNEDLRLKIANNGKEYALKNFTASIMANKTLNVYRKVINNE